MQLRNFDLNLLVTLDVLLRERNVTRAATALFLSQSAMSHSLARLRQTLDDPLLIRGPGGLILTPLAEELREPVRQALLSVERVLGKGDFAPAKASHIFTIGTTDYFDALLMPRLVERLRHEAPNVRILLRNAVKETLNDDLAGGDIDVAISFVPEASLHSQTLFTETYCCVTRVANTGDSATPMSLEDYLAASHILVSPGGTFSGAIDAELARQGYARRVVMSTPRHLSAAEVVARSDLVLTVQTRLAHRFVEHLPIAVVDLPFALPAQRLTMQWAHRTHADPAHAWLRKSIASLGEP